MGEVKLTKAQAVEAIHYLLAELHLALATNKAPRAEVQTIADDLSAWWLKRCAA